MRPAKCNSFLIILILKRCRKRSGKYSCSFFLHCSTGRVYQRYGVIIEYAIFLVIEELSLQLTTESIFVRLNFDVIPWIPVNKRNPGYHIKIEPYENALGRQLERKFLDDKKYGVFDDDAVSLINSAGRTMEKEAAGVFTGAFSTAFQYQNNEEGIALCGSHKTKSGTSTASGFSNSGTSAMNKTSVAATRILMRQFRNEVSDRIEMSDNFALIPPDALADAAYELVNTPKGMDSAEGNVNPQYKRYKVIPYARLDDSDTNNWFMVNMDLMKKALVFISRIKPETRTQIDFHTLVTMISSYMRFAVGTTEWRWIYGHNVT